MQLIRDCGIVKVEAELYSLAFAADRPFVTVQDSQGERLAELFVLSSVHAVHGQDDSIQIGGWQVTESSEQIVVSIEARSSVWDSKVYRFTCSPQRFCYDITVNGQGAVTDVCYFGGYMSAILRWGSGFFWSEQCFSQGFSPEPNVAEMSYFSANTGAQIDLMGVPLPGKAHWFFTPPPFSFGFQSRAGSWVEVGVEADPGAYRFSEYQYHTRGSAFYLSLAYEGHTQVDGVYTFPSIGFDFPADEFDGLRAHVAALRLRGIGVHQSPKIKPVWWYEPIFCGWGSQCYLAAAEHGRAPDFANQSAYDKFLATLDSVDVRPGIVVLDDKWQQSYGDNRVDSAKWPDLPGFVRQQHAAGRKVLLWLKAWDPEGLPVEECITNAAGRPIAVDPTNPACVERLRASVRTMLSAEGYDADGFKIDFTARIPSGPGIHTHGDVWGLELMHLYLEILYSEAKAVKHDALVITHTPHPYLADVTDMIRLNDINTEKDVNQAMTMRARVAGIACPEAIIDTDNWPIPNRAAWRDYLLLQPDLGVPSLYYAGFIDSTKEPLQAEDYQLIREVWMRHRARH